MFGGEAHDSIVGRGGIPDRSSDTVAARQGLVACARPRFRVVASSGRGDCVDVRRRPGGSAAAGLRLVVREQARMCFNAKGNVGVDATPARRTWSDSRGPLSSTLDAARRRRRATLLLLCGSAARPRPRAAPTCRRARTAPKLFRAPPRRQPRRGRGRGRSNRARPFVPPARPPRARGGPGPVLCTPSPRRRPDDDIDAHAIE